MILLRQYSGYLTFFFLMHSRATGHGDILAWLCIESIAYFLDLQLMHILLIFWQHIIMKKTCEHACATRIVCREIFNKKCFISTKDTQCRVPSLSTSSLVGHCCQALTNFFLPSFAQLICFSILLLGIIAFQKFPFAYYCN